jgi:ferritin-like metal-binding protein YciE
VATDTISDVIRRYIKDAIAAESSFESQLEGFAKEGDDPTPRQLFERHEQETRFQRERLEAHLRDLGDSPSTVKSFMAHMFNFAPKTASMGHDEAERTTQNLMIAYAVEHSEVAMYESLATVAESAGDQVTAQLARDIQAEEQRTAHMVWDMIRPSARRAISKLASEVSR